jgi:hypothetical protein
MGREAAVKLEFSETMAKVRTRGGFHLNCQEDAHFLGVSVSLLLFI